MAIIVASREAAKSFKNVVSLCIEMVKKCEKKYAYPALKESPGRWTGNKIIFKGGLIESNNR